MEVHTTNLIDFSEKRGVSAWDTVFFKTQIQCMPSAFVYWSDFECEEISDLNQ